MITIDMDTAENESAEAETGASETLEVVTSVSIPEDISYAEAVRLIADVKDQSNAWVLQRDLIVKPMKAAIAEVTKMFKPSIDKAKEAEDYLKAKVLDARALLHEQADELMGEASSTGDHTLVAKADELRPEEMKGVSITVVYSGKVTDVSQIPAEFLKPPAADEEKLLKYTKACKGDVDIPGWKATTDERMSITVSKIKR